MFNNIIMSSNIVKKGLLIAINYTGSDNQLNGCINDQDNLKKFLIKGNYLEEKDMVLMNDNFNGTKLYPTKENIMKQMDELVSFANKHHDKQIELFFSYSGHGYYKRDFSGDEADGKDEVLCPIDFAQGGRFISDDYIRNKLVSRLGSNVKIFFLMDCCHSGTIIDLKYNYYTRFGNTNTINKKVAEQDCNVIMISGCKDNQTSADAFIMDKQDNKYEYQGAMTASFLNNYHDGISYNELIHNMRGWLSMKGYSQIPQLASGKEIDLDSTFLLCSFNN